MHTVIKGAETIEEYKKMKNHMEQKAQEHCEQHKAACENWKEGNIKKIWIDAGGNICIEYESGNWWHYNENGEWW